MDIKFEQVFNVIVLMACGLLFFTSSLSLGVVLKDMNAVTSSSGTIELVLVFDGDAPDAKGYTIEQPPRVSIDLLGTVSALPKYTELGFDTAQSVTLLQAGDRTRLVVNQRSPTSFSSRNAGNTLYITLGGSSPVINAKTTPVIDRTYSNNLLSSHENYSHQEKMVHGEVGLIDFQRGNDDEGNVIITMSAKDIPIDINEDGGRIKLKFKGNVIPTKLMNRLDVLDFGTQVKYIEAIIEDGNSVIIIEPKNNYEYLAYQADNKLTVSVKPSVDNSVTKRTKQKSYKGEKLSFNFQDIDVRSVLQLIADFTNLNLVASDTVVGKLTLRLKNVPWDQALEIVLATKGLDKRLAGNVLTVAPAEEISAREKQLLENEKQIRELAPVYTDLIQINYADAADMAKVIGGEEGEDKILTEQGSVQVVERTNSLLVKDTQFKLDEIKQLLAEMDVPVRQVLIEARIVTLSTYLRKELGVKWSGGLTKNSDNKNVLLGGRDTTFKFKAGDPVLSGDSFNRLGAKTGFLGENVFTDLSVAGAGASAIGLGFITNGTLLNLELSALLSDGGGEIISQPRVVTADKQTALIKAGKQIPYTEASSSGAATIAFQDALLSLEVTPQITPDGKVIMDIKVTNDDSTETAANGVPIIDKNEITTQVLVADGETVVLGGVFKKTTKNEVLKVPLLGDIPYIGALFRKKTSSDVQSELMVFITPKIVVESVAVR